MKPVTIYGRFSGQSLSYANVALNYACALEAVGVPVALHPLQGMLQWTEAPFWARHLATRGAPSQDGGACLLHHTPDNLPLLCQPGRMNIGLTTWETQPLGNWLVEGVKRLDGLIVPSEYNRASIPDPEGGWPGSAAGVHVVPHCVGSWWWETAPEPEADRPYTYLYVGAWNARKNPQAVLRAYLRAYPTARKDRMLVLKTSAQQALPSLVRAIIRDEGCDPARLEQDVVLYNAYWSEKKLQWLFSQSDCFVSAHHAEGFGLGLLEAKLLGKSVVYTDHSAPREFCGGGDLPVGVALEPIFNPGSHLHFNNDLQGQSLKWARVDNETINQISSGLGDVASFRGYGQASLHEAPSLRDRYNWESIGLRLKRALQALGAL